MEIEKAIAKSATGDTDSYGAVVRAFQGRLRTFIASYCPNADLIDEVAQHAFVWAYEHLNEYEVGTRFYAWLKAIARNILIGELEMQKREARLQRKYLDYIRVVHSRRELVGSDSEALPEKTVALRKCLDELPKSSRALIHDRYETSESIRNISRKMGKKENTVKVALFRIRQVLRRCVESRMGRDVKPSCT